MTEPANPRSVVAVFNDNEETLSLLRTWFEMSGMRCVSSAFRDFRHGHEDIQEFMAKHKPKVLVFDVGLPYEPNWDFLQALRFIPEIGRVPLVVTTANKAALEQLVGPTGAIEIVGKLYDLNALTAAVLSALDAPA